MVGNTSIWIGWQKQTLCGWYGHVLKGDKETF